VPERGMRAYAIVGGGGGGGSAGSVFRKPTPSAGWPVKNVLVRGGRGVLNEAYDILQASGGRSYDAS